MDTLISTSTIPSHWLIAIALGFIVGLQRQWAESPLAGIRTFPLITLFGTICAHFAGQFGAALPIVGLVATAIAMAMGHLTHAPKIDGEARLGLGTEFAMLLMFMVGILVHTGPIWVAAVTTGLIAIILQAKITLHGIAARMSENEIRAMMQFVAITLVILPIVPNESFGPLQVLNPFEIWMMVVLIVGINLGGYIVYRLFGDRAGILLSGLMGGVISSTATTVNYARLSVGKANSVNVIAIIISIAWAVVYLRVIGEVAVVNIDFLPSMVPVMLMFIATAASFFILVRRNPNFAKMEKPLQTNPSELKIALTFAVVYALVVLAVAFAKEYMGSRGLAAVALVSGATDIDAITLSTSRLVGAGTLAADEGWRVIVIALMSNKVFKVSMGLVFGGKPLLKRLAAPAFGALAMGALLLLFY